VQSDLRGRQRWRGRVRGQIGAASVLPVAAVVIILGGLFWLSIWMILHAPTGVSTVASSGTNQSTTWVVDNRADGDDAIVDEDGDGVEPAMLDGQVAEDEDAVSEDTTADSSTGLTDGPDVVGLGPLEGPALPEGVALGDGTGADATDRTSELTAKAEALTARADELTAKAEELTAKAEELTARLEDLTTRIDELQGKLDASTATLAALPAVVPSPSPLAAPRSSQAVARAGQPGTSQAATSKRAPWVVLPQPEPGSRVTAGPLVLETRARGEAPITEIRLQLDGVALAVALERRDDTTWRGRATTRVSPGSHSVAVSVVDGQGRIGSYRWQFDATPS